MSLNRVHRLGCSSSWVSPVQSVQHKWGSHQHKQSLLLVGGSPLSFKPDHQVRKQLLAVGWGELTDSARPILYSSAWLSPPPFFNNKMDHVTETICDQPRCKFCYLGFTRKAEPGTEEQAPSSRQGPRTLQLGSQPDPPRPFPPLKLRPSPGPSVLCSPAVSVPSETPLAYPPPPSSVARSPLPCPRPQFPHVLRKQSRLNSLGPSDPSIAHPHKACGRPPGGC